MKQKPTYQELEKEVNSLRLNNELIEKTSIVKFLWRNEDNWPVEYVSKNVENVLGYSVADFISGKVVYSNLVHNNDLLRVADEVIENSIADKVSFEHEPYRVITKSGEIKWVQDITIIVRNKENKITHYQGLIIDITQKKIIEEELKLQENYLKALNKSTDILLDGDPKIQIQKFIETIGIASKASRTYIFKNHTSNKGELLLSQIAEYTAKGIKPEIDNPELQNIVYNDWLPRWYDILSKGEIINGKVANFPQTERTILEPQEIKAILVIPIMVEGKFWGFIGFDNCINDNLWKTVEIEYLKASADKLSVKIKEHIKQELLENENKRFHTAMDSIDAGVYVADMQTYDLLFINDSFKKLLGDKVGEKCYKALQGLNAPCDFCTNNKLLDKKGNPNETYVWEFQNRITKRWNQLSDKAIQWTDGRFVRLEIAIDITERKETEQNIIKSEAKYKMLAENISDVIWVFNFTKNKFSYISPSVKQLRGYSVEEAMAQPFTGSLTDYYKQKIDNLIHKRFEDFKNGKTEIYRDELQQIKKNGDIIWVEMITSIHYTADNDIEIQGLSRDITERKNYEIKLKKQNEEYIELTKELIESEQKFKRFFENNNAIMLQVHPVTKKILQANSAAVKYYGYTKEELLSKTIDNLNTLPINEIELIMQAAILKESIFFEFKHRLASGEIRDVEVRVSPIKDNDEIILFVIVNDITNRKIAENEVKENNKKLNTILNTFNDGVYLCSSNYDITFLNRGMINRIGHNALGEKCYKAIYNNDKPCDNCNFVNLKKDKIKLSEEKSHANKHYVVSSVLLNNNSKLTVYNDITEIKKSKILLRNQNESLNRAVNEALESKNKYEMLSNLTFEGILLHKKGIVIDVNLSFANMFGYTKKELIGKDIIKLLIHKDYHEIFAENLKKEFVLPYEIVGIQKNGNTFPIELEGRFIEKQNNEQINVVAVRDITFRKEAQKELNRLSAAVEQSSNTIIITDTNGNIVYANPKFTELTGYTVQEVLGQNPRILNAGVTPKEDYKEMWDTITSGNTWSGEFQNITKYGIFFHERVTISPIKDSSGKIINFLAIKEDITEKKKIEQDLIESEKKYRSLFENMQDVYYRTDKDGNLIMLSPSAAGVLGYNSIDEMLQLDLKKDLYFKQEDRDKFLKDINKTGKVYNYKNTLKHKNGNKVFVETTSQIIYDENNNPNGIEGVIRDVTELYMLEQKEKESQNNLFYKVLEAEEKERGRISSDLHDGIGPDLSSLKLHLNAIENAKNKREANLIIRKSYKIIDQSIVNLKQISKALSPYLLKDFGLDSAIRDFIEDVNIGKIDICYQSNIEDVRFSTKIELSIFRIIKELINNSIKYSKASTVKIKISYSENTFILNYSDNGIGFNLDKTLSMNSKNPRFGLRNIISRIKSLNGEVDMKSNLGEGFNVNAKIIIVT